MKLTVEKLYGIVEGLNTLMDKELPIEAAFSVQRNMKMLANELEASDKLRDKIVKKYASEIKKDGTATIPNENKESFQKEYDELMKHEIGIDIEPIFKTQLGDSIKPKTIVQLSDILSDEKKEDEEIV